MLRNFVIDYAKHKFAVVGLGATGISVINYLKFRQAHLIKVFDTRYCPPHQDIASIYPCYYGPLDNVLFEDVDVIVISPGVSTYEPSLQNAMSRGKIVVGDVELFALAVKSWQSKLIGVTGSNGKTTVTTLLGSLAKSYGLNVLVAGNIGLPVLSCYIEIIQSGVIPQIIILELSSFQLESTYSLELTAAVVLNISEDHLDRYRDLLEYAYVKANIFENCKTQVLNMDDQVVMAMKRDKQNKKYISLSTQSDYGLLTEDGEDFLFINNSKYISCRKLNVTGYHNYFNILAALALLDATDIDVCSPKLVEGLISFTGLEHRMQKVLVHDSVTYIEDSKGTNVGAVIAGVSGLDKPVHIILGGDGKNQDFYPLRHLVMNNCKSVAIIGKDKEQIFEVLEDLSIPIKKCLTLQEAVKFCIDNVKKNEYVVLSPACASWDMFTDYKHRAKVFIEAINENIK